MALPITLLGTDGLWMVDGPPNCGTDVKRQCDTNHRIRCVVFSPDGQNLAWCNGQSTQAIRTDNFQVIFQVERPKVSAMKFSPKSTVLAIWEMYTVDKEASQGNPNLHLYDLKTGKLVRSLMQKKQKNWDPNWSSDEAICCRNVNNELHFFENNNFGDIKTKLLIQKVSDYKLAEAGPPYVVAVYVPGSKGQPSFVRVYQYPNFGGNQAALVSKSFFKADTVTMEWNKAGTALLVLTSTETSEQSYYGDTGLYFMSVKGDGCLVERAKNGPIYHMAWNPNSTEFCVVYGFMPAMATVYNLKAEPVFSFGTGPRNICHYNPQGTILCLAGFGNIRGNMEFFDAKKRKLISQVQAPDTTVFSWHPDGEHILTATTSPRLRVGNGYKVWHFTGNLLLQFFVDSEKELREALWCPVPEGTFPPRQLNYKAAQAVAAQVAPKEEKVGAYRPPGARGSGPAPPIKDLETLTSETRGPAGADSANKSVSKNKKKRDARKAKQANAEDQQPSETMDAGGALFGAATETVASTGDPETDKRIRNVKKKLQQIEKLKEQKASGKQLEKNQIEKLATEASLIKELQELELKS